MDGYFDENERNTWRSKQRTSFIGKSLIKHSNNRSGPEIPSSQTSSTLSRYPFGGSTFPLSHTGSGPNSQGLGFGHATIFGSTSTSSSSNGESTLGLAISNNGGNGGGIPADGSNDSHKNQTLTSLTRTSSNPVKQKSSDGGDFNLQKESTMNQTDQKPSLIKDKVETKTAPYKDKSSSMDSKNSTSKDNTGLVDIKSKSKEKTIPTDIKKKPEKISKSEIISIKDPVKGIRERGNTKTLAKPEKSTLSPPTSNTNTKEVLVIPKEIPQNEVSPATKDSSHDTTHDGLGIDEAKVLAQRSKKLNKLLGVDVPEDIAKKALSDRTLNNVSLLSSKALTSEAVPSPISKRSRFTGKLNPFTSTTPAATTVEINNSNKPPIPSSTTTPHNDFDHFIMPAVHDDVREQRRKKIEKLQQLLGEKVSLNITGDLSSEYSIQKSSSSIIGERKVAHKRSSKLERASTIPAPTEVEDKPPAQMITGRKAHQNSVRGLNMLINNKRYDDLLQILTMDLVETNAKGTASPMMSSKKMGKTSIEDGNDSESPRPTRRKRMSKLRSLFGSDEGKGEQVLNDTFKGVLDPLEQTIEEEENDPLEKSRLKQEIARIREHVTSGNSDFRNYTKRQIQGFDSHMDKSFYGLDSSSSQSIGTKSGRPASVHEPQVIPAYILSPDELALPDVPSSNLFGSLQAQLGFKVRKNCFFFTKTCY